MRTWLLLAAGLWAAPALALNDGLPPPASPLDQKTPLAAVDGFLTHAHAEDYAAAAHYLDLSGIPKVAQAEEGPKLARRLKFVLDRKLWLDYAKVSKDPAGDPSDGANVEHLGDIPLGPGSQAIRLDRVRDGGELVWVFSAETVRGIDRLYAQYGAPLGERLPDFMFYRPFWVLELWQWLGLLLCAGLAFAAGYLLERVVLGLSLRVAKLTTFTWDDQLIAAARGPLRLLGFSAFWAAGTRALQLPPPAQWPADVLARTLVIVAFGWFALRMIRFVAQLIQARAAQSTEDVGRLRGLNTQVTVLRHVLEVTVGVVAVAIALMQFEVVRSVGVSLLASAGIAGLVIGLAAQKSISTLLAGIQLSITQPVRIGDTVVLQGEFGTVEEVTLTYVVVRIWDLRRLVVPITQFLDQPFQNWTKQGSNLLGTVELRADYSADVDAFRAELDRLLAGDGKALWDEKAKGVQVTDTSERTMLVRLLVSAADAGKLWDLRCLLRERMLAFLRTQHPEWLPVLRAEVPSPGEKTP